ncbi:IclR family transcriptional regulator [Corynebacterium crudilactis]|uniref:IclR family transcriptional regulator n=1 Tax=Corynebacterium crudilactis TaxID=1652495 RepID=A0A172QWY1_9CORY|nr:IclR family transcriptional regulator [Corynebacterium crudilactis]ANE05140.1 IclR family transcriptional regulator [Corynebacterium crudilactis]
METVAPTQGLPPKDFLSSVDTALQLILLLRDAGRLTISGAASTLDVGVSTIHRSMSMLVYRGFAVRSESRTYLPGPALATSALQPGLGADLTEMCSHYMESMSKETGETSHLMILQGNSVHFIHSVEGSNPVRVGNRRGQVMPATQNAGGLVMLAEMSVRELRGLHPSLGDEEFENLRKRLRRTRDRGHGANFGFFEQDVSAVAEPLLNEVGDVLGAISLAVPSNRFREAYPKAVRALDRHIRDLNRALATYRVPEKG